MTANVIRYKRWLKEEKVLSFAGYSFPPTDPGKTHDHGRL